MLGKWALSVGLLLVLFSYLLEMYIVFSVADSNLPTVMDSHKTMAFCPLLM